MSATFGNQAQALVFFHLMHNDEMAANVKKNSKRLKKYVFALIELSQARLKTDPDGRHRFYFREKSNNEAKHMELTEWFYSDFQRQIFGRRTEISCIQFIERLSCVYNKDNDPNDQNMDEMFSKIVDNVTFNNNVKDCDGDDEHSEGHMSEDKRFDHLSLP